MTLDLTSIEPRRRAMDKAARLVLAAVVGGAKFSFQRHAPCFPPFTSAAIVRNSQIRSTGGIVYNKGKGGKAAVMDTKHPPVQQDDDILGGELVFTGTRVPVHNLIAYLSAGDTIDDFLDDFPTVSREQVIEVLQMTEGNEG